MRFDFVIGNPPYQENDGGAGASAIPVYNKFISAAKSLNPEAISMITPSKWFAGGKGLDSFREEMLHDRQIVRIVDYVNAKDCFANTSIGGGVNYFLWKKDEDRDCEYTNIHDNKESTSNRRLDEFPVFVRYNEAISIIKKVNSFNELNITGHIESRNPFGLSSNTRGNATRTNDDELVLYSSKGFSYINPEIIETNQELVEKYKVMISKVTSEHAGEPSKDGKFRVVSTNKVLKPREVCTDSYLILFSSDSLNDVINFKSYLATRFFRFLLMQAVTSINLSRDKFYFIPDQNYSEEWTDEKLFRKYGLTPEEIEFINSMVKELL